MAAADVLVRGDRIEAVGPRVVPPECGEVLRLDGTLITPGLIDLHLHGFAGTSWLDADPHALRALRRSLLATGVTSALATLPAAPLPRLREAAECIASLGEGETGCLGIALEGAFLSPDAAGGQDRSHFVMPDAARAGDYLTLPGLLEVVVAPELPGGLGLVEQVASRGLIAAIGHTLAGGEIIADAHRAGASLIVHFFNNGGAPQWGARDPGLLGAGLLDSSWWLEIIADGVHVHHGNLTLLERCRRNERVVLVSDSRSAAGKADGRHRLEDGVPVVKTGDRLVTDTGKLAGGGNSLGALFGRALARGQEPAGLVARACANPARLIGRDGRIGAVRPGYRADLVAWTGEGEVAAVLQGGEVVSRP